MLDIDQFPSYLQTSLTPHAEVYTSSPPGEGAPTPHAASLRRKRSWSNYFTKSTTSLSSPLGGGAGLTYDSVISELYARRPKAIYPLFPRVHELRAVKSEAEQVLMKQAGDLSGNAHAKVCSSSRTLLAR